MPQASERLRKKFMDGKDDGIARCQGIIKGVGGNVHQGVITPPRIGFQEGSLAADAVEYLCDEWDYSVVNQESEQMPKEDNDKAWNLSPRLKEHDRANESQVQRNSEAISNIRIHPLGDPSNGTSLEGYDDIDYKPLWDFILVEPVKEKKITEGGIHLPDNAKPLDNTRRCKVIKAGPGFWQNGVFIPNPIKVGQYIYNMAKHMQPYQVLINGKLFLSMPSNEVLAVASSSGYKEEAAVTLTDLENE